MTEPTPHLLRVSWDRGFVVNVDCPHEGMGLDRPCAVWANDDGSDRENECTFRHYEECVDTEDWLHGHIDFAPVAIVEAGAGDDWHAVVVSADA